MYNTVLLDKIFKICKMYMNLKRIFYFISLQLIKLPFFILMCRMKKKNLIRLSIKNAEFYSYHGVKSEERKLGGKFQVDLDLYYDANKAIENDDVKSALNYEQVIHYIGEIINGDAYKLIETIANKILNSLFSKFTELVEATVRVRKLNVPVKRFIDYVEVEEHKSRQ